jgi:hypothetical protein
MVLGFYKSLWAVNVNPVVKQLNPPPPFSPPSMSFDGISVGGHAVLLLELSVADTSCCLQSAGLGHFTVKIKQPPKSVSIASLVVKYKTDNLTLRVLNNSTSDFSLECRTHIYIPGFAAISLLISLSRCRGRP